MIAVLNLHRLREFSADLKKLAKRFPTLEADLETFSNTQLVLSHQTKVDNHGVERIAGIGFEDPQIFKAVKFSCRSLKGKGSKSGIRVIYAFFPKTHRIDFIEIYYKEKDDTKEDRSRIKRIYEKQ